MILPIPCGCDECGEMTAYQFLLWWKKNRVIPLSTEKPCHETSNSEIRRWLQKKSVTINGQNPLPDDKLVFPIRELIFFAKGSRKTTMLG